MLLTDAVARAVAAGTVDLAFRRWARPRIRAGADFVSTAGVIEVLSVAEIDPRTLTNADARRAGAASAADVRRALAGPPGHPTYRIGLRWAGPDPRVELSNTTRLTPAEAAELAERLARLDRRASDGPWTTALLTLLAGNPGVPAADLARRTGHEQAVLKRRVRQLKELGLTHSLRVGYRLAPRGAAYLDAAERRPR